MLFTKKMEPSCSYCQRGKGRDARDRSLQEKGRCFHGRRLLWLSI